MAGAGTGPGEEQGGRVGGGSEEGEGGRERRRGGWQGEAKEDGRRTGRVRIMSIFLGGGEGAVLDFDFYRYVVTVFLLC